MVRKMREAPHIIFFNEHPKYRKHLRLFGEMTVVACQDRKRQELKLEKVEKNCNVC